LKNDFNIFEFLKVLNFLFEDVLPILEKILNFKTKENQQFQPADLAKITKAAVVHDSDKYNFTTLKKSPRPLAYHIAKPGELVTVLKIHVYEPQDHECLIHPNRNIEVFSFQKNRKYFLSADMLRKIEH
jgi:hypothetical protein